LEICYSFFEQTFSNILTPNPLVILTLRIHYFVFGRLHPQSFCQPITKYLTSLYSFFKTYILKKHFGTHSITNHIPCKFPIHLWNMHSLTFCHPTHYHLKHTFANILSPNSLPNQDCQLESIPINCSNYSPSIAVQKVWHPKWLLEVHLKHILVTLVIPSVQHYW
jgi:hypothetical protein